MRHIDRYFLKRILRPFSFFVLVLTCVIWLGQSLRVVDLILSHGQKAFVLLEFAALLLPVAMSIVIPVAALAATIFALNGLLGDSEIVVVQAAGQNRFSAARAVFIFGGMCLVMLAVVTLYLSPLAARELRKRTAELRGDLAAALIQDGRFIHPANGLTVYIRHSTRRGDMLGVMVHDSRDPDAPVTYTATRGAVIEDENGDAHLAMFDGAAQRLDANNKTLSVLRFDRIAYDLSGFMDEGGISERKPRELFFYELVAADPESMNARRYGKSIAEGHEQLSAPLYGFALPVLAAAIMLGGAFSRAGYAGRAAAAALACVIMRMSGLAIKSLVGGTPALWPLFYAPPIIGVLYALWRLGGWKKPAFRLRRRAVAAP